MADSLVIGGNGFIGRRLVHQLLESGRQVRVLSRGADPRDNRPGIEFFRGEVARPDTLMAAAKGVPEVFHLATGGGDQWSDFERDFLTGATNVIQACHAGGARRLVYTSSIAALYLGDSGIIQDATGPDPRPELRANYGRAKALAEAVVRREAPEAVIVRPGVVVGKGTPVTHSGVGYWASDLCCIGWGEGKTPIPFVLVDDVARAMFAAMTMPGTEGRSFNLVGDVRPTARHYVELLAERSMRRYVFFPRSLARLQAIEIFKWTMKVAARKPGNTFPSFRDLKSRSLRTEIDCSAAKIKLGWQPVSDFNTFVREAIDAHLAPIAPGDLRLVEQAG